jgi:hypothetical protein
MCLMMAMKRVILLLANGHVEFYGAYVRVRVCVGVSVCVLLTVSRTCFSCRKKKIVHDGRGIGFGSIAPNWG